MATLKDLLTNRKERIEKRLRKHGISDTSITFLRYLMFDEKSFATPYEVGCRIMIICAIVYTIEEPTYMEAVAEWLKSQGIWTQVGYGEAQYLEGNETDQEQINEFSWQLEAAYILAWALSMVREKPSPSGTATDEQMEEFLASVPAIGDNLSDFLNSLFYRSIEEIFEENIFYELTTAYFRDLLFNGKQDTTDINRAAAFERHKALNWLRRFMDIKDWEETDTST